MTGRAISPTRPAILCVLLLLLNLPSGAHHGEGLEAHASLSNTGSLPTTSTDDHGSGQSQVQPPAQPSILSVVPGIGKVGTAVTINGSGFSPIPLSNAVFFGPVRANVIEATSASLVVAVPAGAAYGPVTVTVDRKTAYSVAPFVPTFEGTGVIGPFSFAPSVDFEKGSHFRWGSIADVDGDGKPDIVGSNDANFLSILRNTSTPGVLNASSFAPRIDVTVGVRPYGSSVGDLDGDGRLDLLVACNTSGVLTVLRNTSMPGSLSFTRQDFPVPAVPQTVAVRDLDDDGRPDVVVSGSQMSIFRNTSVDSTILFAPRLGLITVGGSFTLRPLISTETGRPISLRPST